jgi:lipid A 3-O-deacylase
MVSARLGSMAAGVALACLIVSAARGQSLPSASALGSLNLAGNEPSYLDFGAGAFDIQHHEHSSTTGEGRIEIRYGRKLFYLGPAIGLLANGQGGVFGYAGLYSDLVFGRFVLTPLGAVGGYDRGRSEDLGGTFQFRLSANLAYELDDHSRIGVQFAHISNADIHNRNPGDNELLVTYAIPLHLPF